MENIQIVLPTPIVSLKNTFKFNNNNIEFTSNFDSGNLINCIQESESTFNLSIGEDCFGKTTPNKHSIYRTWFYYSIKSHTGASLKINLVNLNNFSKMFHEGYKIVYRHINPLSPDDFEKSYNENEEYDWKRLSNDITVKVDPIYNQMCLSYDFSFESKDTVLFAFCYPWSYEKNLKFLDYIQVRAKMNNRMYFHREVLVNSKEKRKVELLTITAKENIIKTREYLFKGLFPNGNRCFACLHDKPIIFISARVHPGETPSAFAMNSIIKFLISDDPRVEVLLKSFVFKIIPMINVDGVSLGHFRLDSTGINLNRCYMDSEVKNDPEIFAIKRIFLYYSSDFKVRYYFDLHADMTCSGVYTFGNAINEYIDQVENVLFPFIFKLNCPNVNFPRCNFTEKSMKTKFKNEKHSKEASSRVFFYKKTGLIHTYTVESTYFKGTFGANNETLVQEDEENNSCQLYNVEDFERTGRDLLISILDYEGINPLSILAKTEYKTVDECRSYIATYILANEERYKFDLPLRTKAKEINTLKTWVSINDINTKIHEKMLLKKHNSLNKISYPKIQKNSFRTFRKDMTMNTYDLNQKTPVPINLYSNNILMNQSQNNVIGLNLNNTSNTNNTSEIIKKTKTAKEIQKMNTDKKNQQIAMTYKTNINIHSHPHTHTNPIRNFRDKAFNQRLQNDYNSNRGQYTFINAVFPHLYNKKNVKSI